MWAQCCNVSVAGGPEDLCCTSESMASSGPPRARQFHKGQTHPVKESSVINASQDVDVICEQCALGTVDG